MNSLTLLGTGTCQIEYERRASSALITLEQTHILFDCGHGIVQRLLDAGIRHTQIQHIVLSHFHPDHVSDLIPLLQAGAWSQRDPRHTDLHIYGPEGVQRIVNGLMDLFEPRSFLQEHYKVIVHEVTSEQFSIGPYEFDFVSLPPAGNHGLRFTWQGKRYALTGDSSFHDAEIAFLRNVDMAIIDSGHISDEQIVELAVASQANHLICSHLYRDLNAPMLQHEAERHGYQGTIQVGHDLLSIFI